MSVLAKQPVAALLWRRWRDPAAWASTADVFVILLSLALPWSTSLVAIFAVAFLVAMAPYFDLKAFLASLRRPICLLPLALFALALVGTLWSPVSWGARLYAVGPIAKLLMLPVLLFHFERSARSLQICIAFLISCVLLMAMSWIVAFDPALALRSNAQYGVPVKNYIDQSQEFALCAVALAYPAITLLRTNRTGPALGLIALALGFVISMLVLKVSRTALVTMPIMLAVFALLHLRWRSVVTIICALVLLAVTAYTISPRLRATMTSFSTDYQLYRERQLPTSIGLRLEFWDKALGFMSEAPVFGHGTGSIRALYEEAAINKVGAAAEVVANPHNQTLNFAVQWGTIGVVLLYAMWLVHLRLFRGEGLENWIGLTVVVQNVFTSLFNSHLSDFNEGWMYVVGVAVAGAMVLRTTPRKAPSPGPR